MQRLVFLNFATALLYMATVVALLKCESVWLMLASTGLLALLAGLALWSIGSIFTLWNRYKLRSFYPAAAFVLAVTLGFLGTRYAAHLMLAGTPCSPDSFLRGQAKSDLEEAATRALGHSFKMISAGPPITAEMVEAHPQQPIPPQTIRVLEKYGFRDAQIDDAQSLVTFNYYHMRGWYSYTYTTDKSVALADQPPVITEADVEDWTELIRIAKQGSSATPDEASRIVFCPSIVYPYLQQQLGQAELDGFKSETSLQDISNEQKQLVLGALNRQWAPASNLVENPGITYDSASKMLDLGGCRFNIEGFWVVSLTNQLLKDGILLYADDGTHLRVRGNLSVSEQNKVAWLQVGMMNFLYGNLFKKSEHFNDKYLGDGWYFTIN